MRLRYIVIFSLVGVWPYFIKAEISSSVMKEEFAVKDDIENNKNLDLNNKLQASNIALDEKGNPVFDLNMLHGKRTVELAQLDDLEQVLPGSYSVDLVLNGEALASVLMDFQQVDGKVIPCFTNKILTGLNINLDALPEGNKNIYEDVKTGLCIPIEKIIPDSAANFDLGSLALDISIPQAYLEKVARGYVNPEFWEKGINAGTLRYRLGHYRTQGDFASNSSYASIEGGLNYNGWNFRHFGYYSSQSVPGFSKFSTYDSINTYVERAIPGIKANITIGDSFTDGAVTESLGIRGIQLASSELMLPVSMRGYSPVVRGIALTNAKVEVFQNGSLIYETTVAPGPFVIDDLYQSGNNANLEVIVTESDGSRTSFVVPSPSVPQLVRDQQLRYSLAAGKFRNAGSTTNTVVARATAQYGITNFFTAYGGLTLAKDYFATLVGGVYGTDYGAFSGDIEFSRNKVDDIFGAETFTGNRVRVGYAKFISATKSNIDISAYSYGENYWSIQSKSNYDDAGSFVWARNFQRERRKIQFAYSQSLSDYGSVYALISTGKIWNSNDSILTAQLGYSKTFTVNNYSFGMNFNYIKSRFEGFLNEENDRFSLTFTFPLERNRGNSNVMASFAHDRQRGNSEQLRYNGVTGDDNRLGYGLYAEKQESQGSRAGGNFQYRASAATFDGSLSSGTRSNNTQISAAVSGGVVFHSGGLTFANQLGDTVGLIHAPGAKGALVQNSTGIEVDSNGYAVVPYMNAYQINNILLDTKNVSMDVNFNSTTEQAIPYENAVVLLKFETKIGKSALFDINRQDGSPPPFGSVILSSDGKESGIVGQGGNTFVYGLSESKGFFDVKWGSAADQLCRVEYDLSETSADDAAYSKYDVSCLK